MSEHELLPPEHEPQHDIPAPPPKVSTGAYRVAQEIARQLNETQPPVIGKIKAIVKICGAEKARAWTTEALQIEANGGLMVEDGSRRRTVGGVFFYLVKQRLKDTAEFTQIFPEQAYATARKANWERVKAERKEAKARARAAREAEAAANPPPPKPEKPKREPPPPPPSTSPASREEITAAIPALVERSGEMRSMRVHITGRPDAIEQRDQTVMFALQLTKFPPMPRGLPEPPPLPQTYLVFVGLKQWKRVAEAIANPDDFLIIEGICAYDPELGQQVLYVNSITTKLLEDDKRAPKPPREASTPAETAAPTEAAPDVLGKLRANEAKLQRRVEEVKALPFTQRKELPSLLAQLQEVQAQIAAKQS